jgi:hypothetical protein
MASTLPNLLDPMSIFSFASTGTASGWISLGINLILSTLVAGIALIVLAEVFSHFFKESIKPQNAFLVSLIGNIIITVVFMFGFVSFIPMSTIIVPLLIWFLLTKVFFSEMNILHAFLVALVFFFITILVIPTIVGIVSGFIPSF